MSDVELRNWEIPFDPEWDWTQGSIPDDPMDEVVKVKIMGMDQFGRQIIGVKQCKLSDLLFGQ